MTYDLNESLDIDFAPAWIANEFDKLIGVVVDKSSRTTEYGEYPILTVKITQTPTPVRLKDGEAKAGDVVAWHAMGTIAMSRANEARIGDTIAVKRRADYAHKTRKDKSGKPTMMADWKVIIDSARTSAPAADVVDDGPSADELI
mgnify:CR=1